MKRKILLLLSLLLIMTGCSNGISRKAKSALNRNQDTIYSTVESLKENISSIGNELLTDSISSESLAQQKSNIENTIELINTVKDNVETINKSLDGLNNLLKNYGGNDSKINDLKTSFQTLEANTTSLNSKLAELSNHYTDLLTTNEQAIELYAQLDTIHEQGIQSGGGIVYTDSALQTQANLLIIEINELVIQLNEKSALQTELINSLRELTNSFLESLNEIFTKIENL